MMKRFRKAQAPSLPVKDENPVADLVTSGQETMNAVVDSEEAAAIMEKAEEVGDAVKSGMLYKKIMDMVDKMKKCCMGGDD